MKIVAKVPLTRTQQYATEALIFIVVAVGVFCFGLVLIALSAP